MNLLKAKFALVAGLFDSLSLRERLMIMVLVLSLVGGIWLHLLWDKESALQGRIRADLDQLTEQNSELNTKLNALVSKAERDPNVAIRGEIEQAKRVISQMQGRIKDTADALIEPQEMARLLEQILLSSESLTLIKLNTLKTVPLAQSKKSDKAATEAEDKKVAATERQEIFRHGFIVEFEGDYLSVLRYLQSLEALPWQFFWDGIDVSVREYPVTRVRLQLHTLSLSEGWIGV